MRVVIKEKLYEYNSDFPDGWNFSKGDYFKIVKLNGNKCFIKRFEVRSPENISGWRLMLNLRGKNEKNLARLHDIAETQENGKTVYYVFYESIEGETLHALVSKKNDIDLMALTEDLFSGIHSLQKKEYWFADFTEKNIYCNEKGTFILIDLDSTQPAALAPNNDMWGDKQYWILVFNFYRKILHKQQLATSDINGVLLNYLSIVFLILRLKIYYSGEKDYHSQELYDDLPALLDNSSPSFRLIFDKLFKNNSNAVDEADIGTIKNLIKENILNVSPRPVPEPAPEPVIEEFTITGYLEKNENNYVIETKKPFSLHWNVKNALQVELLKNNEFYKAFSVGEQNITLTESFDKEKEVKYTLAAYNNASDKKYSALTIISNPSPVINEFILNGYYEKNGRHYTLEAGKNFSLSWNIDSASRIELYKNGKLYKKFSSDKNGVELTKNAGESEENTEEYFLIALNGSASAKTESLYVTLADIPPAINYLTVSNYTKKNNETYAVENNKPFLLKWSVKNASTISLYKGGVFFKQLDKDIESIELTEEAYDGKEKDIEYRLQASNNNNTVSSTVIVKVIHIPPSINEFKADKYTVKSGKIFKLKWSVDNATVIELYRNGELYETFTNNENSLELTEEAYDNRQAKITYSLVAINGALDSKSNPITIIIKTIDDKPKFIWPAAIVLASLVLLLLFWKLVLPVIVVTKPGTDTTTHSNTRDTTNTIVPTAVSLPPSLNEIWQSNSGKQLVNINIPQKLIYYTAGRKYSKGNIDSVHKVDAGTYKINVTTTEGNKVFLIRNIVQQSFDLSVCDAEQANCSDYESMQLYYKPDASLVYLPVVNNPENGLQASEKNKLERLVRNSNDSFNVNVYSSNGSMNALNVTSALNVLNSNGIHYTVAQQNINGSDPFQRDYITIASKPPAPVTVNNPKTYIPDCNRVFNSITQTKKLASPLIVCKLDLSKASIKTIPAEVYAFKNLQELTLASNSVSDHDISSVKTALPACIIKFVEQTAANNDDRDNTVPGRRSLGYLQFDENGQLTDASKALLDRVVDRLLQDTSAKIIFLSKWVGGDRDQLNKVSGHIDKFVRYIQGIGIKSSSTQVSSELTKSEKEDVNKVNVIGVNFPKNF